MPKENYVGVANMESTTKVHRDEDPLLFLKKPLSRSGNGVEFGSGQKIATRKRHAPSIPMDKIFKVQTKPREEMDITKEGFHHQVLFLSNISLF